MMRRVFQTALMLTLLLAANVSVATAADSDDAMMQWLLPGKAAFSSRYGIDALFLAGTGYRELESKTLEVSFIVDGLSVEQPVKRLVDGYWMRRVELAPVEGGSRVTVGRDASARGLALAVSPGSEYIPETTNVILSLTAGAATEKERSDTGAGDDTTGGQGVTAADADYPVMPVATAEPGKYRFPASKRKYKYSDVLVDLNLVNTDFRQVLMLMSDIGNVSIILDPYWDDEPTGGRRRPGGSGGAGGGGGDGGDGEGPGGPGDGGDGQGRGGFRGAETFQAQLPRSGTGNLTMNLEGVPFDLALDLILTAVNLEKLDVYPGFFDQPVAGVDEPEPGQYR